MISPRVKVYTENKIEALTMSESKKIAVIQTEHTNEIAKALNQRIERENKFFERLNSAGGLDRWTTRTDFVESLIERQKLRNEMMQKVVSSGLVWAFISFLGFLAFASWESISSLLKIKISG